MDLHEWCVHLKQAAVVFVSVEQAPAVWRPEPRQADPFQTLEKHSDHHSAAINSSTYLLNRSREVKESGEKNKKRQEKKEYKWKRGSGGIQKGISLIICMILFRMYFSNIIWIFYTEKKKRKREKKVF